GVAAGEGRPVGRIRRRARPRLARQRQDVDERHSARDAGVEPHHPDRRVAPTGRHGLPGHHALQARRLQALRVGHHGLRPELAPHHRRPARDVLRARGARRPGAARPRLLFAGTETGVFVSFDDGARWQPLRMALPGSSPATAASPTPTPRPPARTAATRPEGSLPAPAGTAPETPAGTPIETLTAASTHDGELPVVPVTDLVVKGDDLVVATQGRSFWILDDLSPLRQMAAGISTEDAPLFSPRAASRYLTPEAPPGTGENPPSGAVVYYWLRTEPKDKEEI